MWLLLSLFLRGGGVMVLRLSQGVIYGALALLSYCKAVDFAAVIADAPGCVPTGAIL